MAAGQEIKGSREERETGKMTFGTQLFVTDDDSTGLPAIGSLFPDDSGISGRVCTEVTSEPEVVPGIYYHVATFQGFVAGGF